MNFLGHVVRFIVAAIVLMVTGWIVPAFSVGSFWSALILALVIALFGWIVEGIFGKKLRRSDAELSAFWPAPWSYM